MNISFQKWLVYLKSWLGEEAEIQSNLRTEGMSVLRQQPKKK